MKRREPGECAWCGELVEPGEQSAAFSREPMHRECGFRAVMGSVAHIERRCSCFVPGSEETDPPGLSLREAARAAMRAWEQPPKSCNV